MLWFAVWTTLVVATLVGAVLLARSLWRKGRALLQQLQESTEVLERLQRRVEELEAARGPEPTFRPSLLADERQRVHWRELRAGHKASRAVRRQRRHATAFSRWHDIVG